MADPVNLSHELTDQQYGRPVVKAIRDLARAVNDHSAAIPDLTSQITQIVTQSLPQVAAAAAKSGGSGGGAGSGSGSGAIRYGPHATRVALPTTGVTDGTIWYETDRALTYQFHPASGWIYLAGIMVVSLAGANPLPPGSSDGAGGFTGLPADSSDGGQTSAGFAAAGLTGHPAGPYDGTAFRAGLIIGGTVNEWPALSLATADQATRNANMAELLGRMIWHLITDGYTAGNQRNPSGIISGDKLSVAEDGGIMRAFDVMSDNGYTLPLATHANQVSPANYVATPGIHD